MRNLQLDFNNLELDPPFVSPTARRDSDTRSHYHPAFNTIDHYISQFERPKILDLGSSSASSMRHFRGRHAQIRFECLDEFIRESLIEGIYRNKLRFLEALERYLDVESDQEKYHVILGWDIACYLDAEAIHLLTNLLRKKCLENSLLHFVRYWRSPFPEHPCRYQIVGANRVRTTFDSSVLRHQMKPLSFIELTKPITSFDLDEQFVNQPGMHNAITEALFIAKPEADIQANEKHRRTFLNPFDHVHLFDKKTDAIDHDNSDLGVDHFYGVTSPELHHQSSILPCLFAPYLISNESAQSATRKSGGPAILDLGAHNNDNTAFYEFLGGKPLFANIHRLLEENSLSAITGYMPSLFPTRSGLTFDIVMGWDILFQYPQETVSKVFKLLEPHITVDTKMHFLRYAPQHQHAELENCTIKSLENIGLKLRPGRQIARQDNQMGVAGSLNMRELVDTLNNAQIEMSRRYCPGMIEGTNEYLVSFSRD